MVFADVQAGYLKVEPVIIDERGNPREIFEETVILTNNANYKINIYASVHNLDKKEGEREFYGPAQSDLTKSLANWIEINRGVIQLLPGEKRNIDFLIKIGPRAIPGIYHANVAFYEGSDRIEAEKRMAGPAVLINLEIAEKNDGILRLKKFAADRTFSPGFPVSFTYELSPCGRCTAGTENSETVLINLSGEIIIFNRRGEEVGSRPISGISFGEAGKILAVSPNNDSSENSGALANFLELNKNFGRYKAILYLRSGNLSPIQDIAFFWVIPWQILTVLIFTLFAIIVITAHLFRRFYEENNS